MLKHWLVEAPYETSTGSQEEAIRALEDQARFAAEWRKIPPPKRGARWRTHPDRHSRLLLGGAASLVYFIRSDDNRMKIGFTRNLQLRMATLRSVSPRKLELVGFVRGTAKDEKYLHGIFCRLRAVGEWFWNPDVILRFIKEESEYTFLPNPGL